MKIQITLADNDRIALLLPIECAPIAAQLMASAEIMERDGYYATSGWKRAEKGVQITYVQDGEIGPTDPKVEDAEKRASESNSRWYAEQNKRVAAEKDAAELRAQLEGIRSVTQCQVADSEPDADGEPEINDDAESEYA